MNFDFWNTFILKLSPSFDSCSLFSILVFIYSWNKMFDKRELKLVVTSPERLYWPLVAKLKKYTMAAMMAQKGGPRSEKDET